MINWRCIDEVSERAEWLGAADVLKGLRSRLDEKARGPIASRQWKGRGNADVGNAFRDRRRGGVMVGEQQRGEEGEQRFWPHGQV